MAKVSAGVLLYRWVEGTPQVLLVHPGGPFWRKKDAGAWSIPKGEAADGEDLREAALREFAEETGTSVSGPLVALESVVLKSGKVVHAWAVEGDLDVSTFKSNTFTMEWPPRSGKQAEFPEADRAEFFDLATAKAKINTSQAAFVEELEKQLHGMR